jgi:hypothetical protein
MEEREKEKNVQGLGDFTGKENSKEALDLGVLIVDGE